jgi:hypothetical protein
MLVFPNHASVTLSVLFVFKLSGIRNHVGIIGRNMGPIEMGVVFFATCSGYRIKKTSFPKGNLYNDGSGRLSTISL